MSQLVEEPVHLEAGQVVDDALCVLSLGPQGREVAARALETVKRSTLHVTQMRQTVAPAAARNPANPNGIKKEAIVRLCDQYEAVQQFVPGQAPGHRKDEALYMHNKSLVEVLGKQLTHELYKNLQPLDQDVMYRYPKLYISEFPKSSSDVLIGTATSWTPMHQDLPLYTTSVILVLEGHKEFAVVPDEVAASLPTIITSAMWDQPFTFKGTQYKSLMAMVNACDGAIFSLGAGDMLLMPPRVFHFARNRENTVSCNFSLCTMDCVPLMLSQTLSRIEDFPEDVMHFDEDFALLLEDATGHILEGTPQLTDIARVTSASRLPPVKSLLEKSARLMEWYTILQSVPRGWVQGFWGKSRDQLLQRILAALPLHTLTAAPAAPARKAGPPRGGGAGDGNREADGDEADAETGLPPAPARMGKMMAAAVKRPRLV